MKKDDEQEEWSDRDETRKEVVVMGILNTRTHRFSNSNI